VEAWPDGTVSGRYGFVHALYQQVVYERLPVGRQMQLHRRIGRRLEVGYGAQATERAAALAMHFERGHDPVRAVRYMQQAADNALQCYACQEASDWLRRGLALLNALPETPARVQQELEMQLALGPVLIMTKGWTTPDLERTYERARDLCQQLGETALLFPALFGLWMLCLVRLEVATARQLAEQLLTLAQELAHPFSQALALHFAARLHQWRREPRVTYAHATASLRLCTEQAFTLYAVLGTILQGWALAAQGQGAAGMARMRQGLAAYQATGTVLTTTYWLALLAEACGRDGQVEAGLSAVAEALAAVAQSGERFYEAELYRLQGELMLQRQAPELASDAQPQRPGRGQPGVQPVPGVQAKAEGCLHQALAVARRQQARSLELRAAVSLSRLWQSQGKRIAAHELLAPIYGWFTEGFDTADLQEAKALLEALGEGKTP
jgi:predicted ATPase